jgi:stearoyl-CoA desaturase (Delta-9 desaturase)
MSPPSLVAGTTPNLKESDDPLLLVPHLGAPLVAIVGAILVPFHWWYPVVAVGFYLVRMLFLTGGYHRYFSHKSYKTSRAFQFVLALLGSTCVQRGPLWWSSHHRAHHRFADTDNDVHSPVRRSLWWAHMGWLLVRSTNGYDPGLIKDLVAFPELRWVERYTLLFPVSIAAAMLLFGGPGLLVWGFFVSTTLLWHGTYCINSLAHRLGKVRYATGDGSRNNWVLALITLGEGWHNNHHHFAASVRQGFFWWEIDITYYVLRMLAWAGVVWDLREVSKRLRSSGLASA